MCVILYKQKGDKISQESLKLMATANPHGIGAAYLEGNLWRIKKGLTVKLLTELLYDYDNVIAHFRLATSGIIGNTMCHPFLLSKNVRDCTAKNTYGKCIIAHNGIVSNYGNNNISDTVDFITNVMCKLATTEDVLKLCKAIGSKWIITDGKDVHLIGHFERLDIGLVSNTHWRIPKVTQPTKIVWNNYNWSNELDSRYNLNSYTYTKSIGDKDNES